MTRVVLGRDARGRGRDRCHGSDPGGARGDRVVGRDGLAQTAAATGIGRLAGHLVRGRRRGEARFAGRRRELQDHLDLFVIAECTGDHTYDNVAAPTGRWAGCSMCCSARAGGVVAVRDGGFWVRGSRGTVAGYSVPPRARLGIEAGVARLECGRDAQLGVPPSAIAGIVRLASADPKRVAPPVPLLDPNYFERIRTIGRCRSRG